MSNITSKTSNRKLLVLDLDNTLCDFEHPRSTKELYLDKGRPYLIYFLTLIYEFYDIIIWSATSQNCLIGKLRQLGLIRSRCFRILKCLDESDMTYKKYGNGFILVKSLEVIWKNYREYNHTNTLMIDDQEINFYSNPENGLKIKPYFQSMHSTDKELFLIGLYLQKLALHSSDFSIVNHKEWKKYNPV